MSNPTTRGRRPGSPIPLLGPSAIARQLRQDFERATRPCSRTLILAAAGTDAAGIARAIHAADAAAPFVEIDCAGKDPAAIERELLGRPSKGGTGELEHVDASAALVAARRGTCVLHAVEELSSRAQGRLARALRDGEVQVRAGRAWPVRCRIVAVASAFVDADREAGQLRADLRRRLGVVRLELPPLMARREDIPEILIALMAHHAAARRIAPRPFTDAALALISALHWPDNLAGLASLVESIVVNGPGAVRVEEVLAHLGAPGQPALVPHASLREARRQFERDYIRAVLRRFDGHVAAAARALGIQRTNLYRKARQLGINGRGRAS
jgi:two-component system nitrogen regulation response regulator NtrX